MGTDAAAAHWGVLSMGVLLSLRRLGGASWTGIALLPDTTTIY